MPGGVGGGDDPDVLTAVRDDGGPVLHTDTPNQRVSRLVDSHGRYLDQVRITPELLSLDEVDTMLPGIGAAFGLVELGSGRRSTCPSAGLRFVG
jgi:hypothetical protein